MHLHLVCRFVSLFKRHIDEAMLKNHLHSKKPAVRD